jgi:undecaprenyl-diphosphatase
MVRIENDRAAWRLALLWIGLWTVLRLVYGTLFLLTPDETNYWQWGRHLAFGYHDQAPLIGWAIGLSTRLFGDTEFAVRLPTGLAMAVASIYLVAFARRWFGARTAWAVALSSQGLLLFNVGGVLSTADGIQAAAWAGAAYHTARAFEEDSWTQWLGAGFWLGFGLLSKFTMVVFAASALGYGLFCATHRHRLRSVKPYVGIALALAMFSPVLWWNAAHGWNSARHVAGLGGAGQTALLQLKFLGDFVGSQIALLSPVVFVGMLWAWVLAFRQPWQPQSWPVVFCLWTSVPMVALFFVLSLHTRVYGNWPAAGYLTAGILVAAFFAARPVFWAWLVGTAYAVSVVLLSLVLLQTSPWAIPLNPRYDRLAKELLGWDKLGAKAAAMLATMPEPKNTFLFATRYQEASELAFYTPGRPATVSINRWHRPNVYDYWWQDKDLIGQDAIGVISAPEEHLGRLLEVFRKVDPPEALPVYRGRNTTEPVKTYYLYRCYGFKGGLRYVAPRPVN